jgi:ribonuclease J
MAKTKTDELVFVPLGGVGEIGMNMAAYGFGPEHQRKWIVVDCGVSFGGPAEPGIELIMGDPSFLEELGDDVVGLVLTHSHEDHYGAVLDLWPGFDLPVYATAFTAAMLEAKRVSNGVMERMQVIPMQPGKPFQLGPFTIEPINMAHSIPESNALLITTPVGRAVHSGDWKLDPTPIGSAPSDVDRLREIGAEEGPLALICDSTNAMKEGESPSEVEIGETLTRLIAEAPNRVAVTTFASNLGRIISIAKAAQAAGRQVVLSGRSLHRVTTIARELGMMEGVQPFLDQDMYAQLARDKVVVLCTGSQGEARAAVARIAACTHPAIELSPGDTMIFSSWAIPGNEREVLGIQNRLIDQGVSVITNAHDLVHVTGHPRRGELKRMYEWLKPDVLVPVHGEAAHLEAHAALGRAEGIGKVISIRNGDMVRLFPDAEHLPGEVPVGQLYLDGDILCTPEESGVRGRRKLSFGGFVAVSVAISKSGELVSGPEIEIVGLPELEDPEEESPRHIARRAVKAIVRGMPSKRRGDADVLGEAIRRGVRGEIASYWGRKPNVHVFVHRV